MKIVKCCKCGKKIHEAPLCLYCGNANDFKDVNEREVTIHDYVIDDYEKMASLLNSNEFEEAEKLGQEIIAWSPSVSNLYWMRLLAKKKCSNDIELVCKGFSPEEDGDYLNAVKYASNSERETYQEVAKIVNKAHDLLLGELESHETLSKLNTGIVELKRSMETDINNTRTRLFNLWTELEKTEQSLCSLESNIHLLDNEFKSYLERGQDLATSINTQAAEKKSCTKTEYFTFNVYLDNAVNLSHYALKSLDKIKKKHSQVKQFQNLIVSRNNKVDSIRSEIDALKKYENNLQKIINANEKIELSHLKAIEQASEFDYTLAKNVLGEDLFKTVMMKSGVEIELPSNSLNRFTSSSANSLSMTPPPFSIGRAINNLDDQDDDFKTNEFNSSAKLSDLETFGEIQEKEEKNEPNLLLDSEDDYYATWGLIDE